MMTGKVSRLINLSRVRSEMASIDLGELAAEDQVLIWTENSFYRFRISDAASGRGWLLRAGRSHSSAAAILLGVTDLTGREARKSRPRLVAGMRAMWLIAQGDEVQSVLTSAITRLILIKSIKLRRNEIQAAICEDHAGPLFLPIHQD